MIHQREFNVSIPGFATAPTTVVITETGSGNMGDVSDRTDRTARLVPETNYILVGVRVRFSAGAAQDVATLTMYLDHGIGGDINQDEDFDLILEEWEKMGYDTGTGEHIWASMSVRPDEFANWTFDRNDHIVLTWTDPGTTTWAIEWRYIKAGV